MTKLFIIYSDNSLFCELKTDLNIVYLLSMGIEHRLLQKTHSTLYYHALIAILPKK